METESQFFTPHKLSGERDYPDIGIEAEMIYGLLLRADAMMTKTDRIRYNDRAIVLIQDIMSAFVMAYDFPEDRLFYLKQLWSKITIFIRLMRRMGEANVIRIPAQHESMSPNTLKIELMNHLGRMDEGATRWKASISNKGTRTRSSGESPKGQ